RTAASSERTVATDLRPAAQWVLPAACASASSAEAQILEALPRTGGADVLVACPRPKSLHESRDSIGAPRSTQKHHSYSVPKMPRTLSLIDPLSTPFPTSFMRVSPASRGADVGMNGV